MSSVLGICNLHDCPRLGRLTAKRSIGAVTFLGRYGLIDFALSNFSNSGIDKVAILVENYSHSIRTHVLNGNAWINNTKTGFQKILYNEKQFSSQKFNTDINNILYNKLIVDDIDSDYVIIAAPFFLASMDFRPMLKKHIKSGKQISVVYKNIKTGIAEYENCDTLQIEKNGNVVSAGIYDGKSNDVNISLETFIVNRATFDEIVTKYQPDGINLDYIRYPQTITKQTSNKEDEIRRKKAQYKYEDKLNSSHKAPTTKLTSGNSMVLTVN